MPNNITTIATIIHKIDDLKGVSFHKISKLYVAQYKFKDQVDQTKSRTEYLGMHINPIDAAIAYDRAKYQALLDGKLKKISVFLNFGVPDSPESLANIEDIRKRLDSEISQEASSKGIRKDMLVLRKKRAKTCRSAAISVPQTQSASLEPHTLSSAQQEVLSTYNQNKRHANEFLDFTRAAELECDDADFLRDLFADDLHEEFQGNQTSLPLTYDCSPQSTSGLFFSSMSSRSTPSLDGLSLFDDDSFGLIDQQYSAQSVSQELIVPNGLFFSIGLRGDVPTPQQTIADWSGLDTGEDYSPSTSHRYIG